MYRRIVFGIAFLAFFFVAPPLGFAEQGNFPASSSISVNNGRIEFFSEVKKRGGNVFVYLNRIKNISDREVTVRWKILDLIYGRERVTILGPGEEDMYQQTLPKAPKFIAVKVELYSPAAKIGEGIASGYVPIN